MITLKNPDTGEKMEMDANAIKELSEICERALEKTPPLTEIVFRAMRLDLSTAVRIAEAKL